MSKNKLLSSFCIKWTDDPRWDEFIDWLNDKYGTKYHGHYHNYYYGVTKSGNADYYDYTDHFENVITLDEFFNMIKEKPTEEVVSDWIFVPKADLKKIYDVACNTWKAKIVKYAEREPFDTHSRLSAEEVDEMFNAATKDQKVVLEAIFGTRDKSVDVTKWDFNFTRDCVVDYDKSILITGRASSNYKNKGLWLSSHYNWELVTDNESNIVLVPTRK